MKQTRPLYSIADDITADHRAQGKKLYFGAVPYVQAMQSLDKATESYGADSAKTIVVYALSNLSTWRGEKAREIKKELNAILK